MIKNKADYIYIIYYIYNKVLILEFIIKDNIYFILSYIKEYIFYPTYFIKELNKYPYNKGIGEANLIVIIIINLYNLDIKIINLSN